MWSNSYARAKWAELANPEYEKLAAEHEKLKADYNALREDFQEYSFWKSAPLFLNSSSGFRLPILASEF